MNLKYLAKTMILMSIISFVLGVWVASYQIIKWNQEIKHSICQFPVCFFSRLNGKQLNFLDIDVTSHILFIYFETDCSFCQFELKELERRVPEFGNTEIVMVSAEPLVTLQKLNRELEFDLYPNASIYHCPYDTLQNYFGKLVAPSTFVYGKDKRLLKKFKGATSINDMLEVIEQEMIKNGDHPMYEYE